MAGGLGELQVLLAEDNQHMRAIVVAVLKAMGVRRIREANDGAQALDIIKSTETDLAIVDFNMSPIDGVEFTRLVRNADDSRNPYLPIIMLTGHSERHRVEEARDAGVNEFIVKPVTARAVCDRVAAVINKPRPFVRTPDYFGPARPKIDQLDSGRPMGRPAGVLELS